MKQVYAHHESGYLINIKLARWELDILVVCASTLISACAGAPQKVIPCAIDLGEIQHAFHLGPTVVHKGLNVLYLCD